MIKEEMDQMRLKGQVSNRGGGGSFSCPRLSCIL